MTSNDQESRHIEGKLAALLQGLEPPVPPPELRSQVLTPALQALQREPAPDLWTRLWSSRPLRLAWMTATTALVLAHLAVTVLPAGNPGPERAERKLVARADGVEAELAEVVQLPRLRLEAPRAGLGIPGVTPDSSDRRNNGSNNNATNTVAASTEESSA